MNQFSVALGDGSARRYLDIESCKRLPEYVGFGSPFLFLSNHILVLTVL
jgi:hypothetical protein